MKSRGTSGRPIIEGADSWRESEGRRVFAQGARGGGTPPTSELRTEHAAEVVGEFDVPGARFEFREDERFGAFQVVVEAFQETGGGAFVDDVEGDLVVDGEGAVVEIDGADGGEDVVHDHDFAVVHRGQVLVHADAGFEEFAPARAGGGAAEAGVVDRGDDHIDFDAAFAGGEEHVDSEVVGDEVGLGDLDGFAGGGDGEEVGDAGVLGVFVTTAFVALGETVADAFGFGKIIRADEEA